MNALSPWLLSVNAKLNDPQLKPVFDREAQGYSFKVYFTDDSCWLVAGWPKGSRIAFRLAYSPDDRLELVDIKDKGERVIFRIKSLMGAYESAITLPDGENIVLRLTTTLKPAAPLLFPFWPRDIVPLGASGSDVLAEGEIKVSQVGTRSGQLYFSLSRPKAGSVLYLQNLTELAAYNQQTETSAGDTVGGEWPDIGFALPPTLKNKPLEAGRDYVLNDAFIGFSEEVPADEPAMVRQYLDLLAAIYLELPKPATTYKDWPDALQKGLTDLSESPGCWSQVDGNHYLNAYVCDYATPPEIMVQLAVLLPLLDYVEWNDAQLAVMKKIKDGLPAFYNEKYGTIMRWHPKGRRQDAGRGRA